VARGNLTMDRAKPWLVMRDYRPSIAGWKQGLRRIDERSCYLGVSHSGPGGVGRWV